MKRRSQSLFITLFCVFFSLFSSVSQGNYTDLEQLHADALADFHDKHFVESLKKISRAAKVETNYVPLLELKALNLKSLSRFDEATQTYEQLSQLTQNNATHRARYEFELGLLYSQKRDYSAAKKHLLYAKKQNFNNPTTQYLLGTAYLNLKQDSRAEPLLKEAAESELPELRSQSLMGLAQLHANQKNYGPALAELVSAREIASNLTSDAFPSRRELGQQILTSTQPLFDAFSASQSVGQVATSSAYDSNVLLNPTSNADASSQSSTLKQNVQYGLFYQSPAFSNRPYTISWQGLANYNFNSDTKAGQFFINDFNATYGFSGKKLKFGAKVGAQHIMRVGADGSSFAGRIGQYSSMLTVGPFVRQEVTTNLAWNVQLLFQPALYYQDNEVTDSYRKTGWGSIARLSFEAKSLLGMKNAEVSVFGDLREPSGNEFRSRAIGADLTGMVPLSSKFSITPTAILSYSTYPLRDDGFRGDWFLSGQISGQYLLTQNLAAQFSLLISKNFSSVPDVYEYFRWVSQAGVQYIF